MCLAPQKHDFPAKESYWRERIAWYPAGCFGPYRGRYSRRELAADAAVHFVGCGGGLVAAAMLAIKLATTDIPLPIALGLGVYALSLLTMLGCSALFNLSVRDWSAYRWELQLADHLGILLLIAGTYTPFMMHACSPRTLGFVWALGLLSFAAKASRSRLDVIPVHVFCFLAMGWACVAAWEGVVAFASPWAVGRLVLGGCLYTGGLVPWACNRLEFHNAVWHVFVLAGTAVFFSIVWHELSAAPVCSAPALWAPAAAKLEL
mmetsp:Transcript_5234/g.15530  ORF Transcript_5234/g.15530 Transcript_5234/m.15530 type:complete len:262 (-) Transcript_5234:65-850(-)